jgi:16S rRNA (uracil1498-N3)-methyltransferase
MHVHLLPDGALFERSIHLRGPEAKHIVQVLRHRPGDAIVFSDGRGTFLHTLLERCDVREVHARIERTELDRREAGAPWKTLALALLKGDHFELALQMGVELGLHSIQPLLADHCVVRWKNEGAGRKLERWRGVAAAALKQSGRSWLLAIREPLTVADFLRGVDANERLILADETIESPLARDLRLGAEAVTGIVGPEGAFSARERELFQRAGVERVSLGSYLLRAETAAVALCAALLREPA